MSDNQEVLLIQLAERLTGGTYASPDRRQHLLNHVMNLQNDLKAKSIHELLILVSQNADIFARFVSAITIHTTSWFRERDQIDRLVTTVAERVLAGQKEFRIWCAACATGEEAYSLALALQVLKGKVGKFDFVIEATDLDLISIQEAKKGHYAATDAKNIPKDYQDFLVWSMTKANFTLLPAIKDSVRFSVGNLDQDLPEGWLQRFDMVFCRNVLIYFHSKKVVQVVARLMASLKPQGLLYFAASEALFQKVHGLENCGHATYQKIRVVDSTASEEAACILVVDDSPVERKILSTAFLRAGYRVEVAEDAEKATQIANEKKIDLVTLDLEMPGKHGSTWLREYRAKGYQTPVIVVSACDPYAAEVVFGALSFGAQDFFDKAGLFNNLTGLLSTIESLLFPKPQGQLFVPPKEVPEFVRAKVAPDLILIGASTGGPDAIWQLLRQFPKPTPPILIVQHTSEFFSSHFALTVGQASGLAIAGQTDGEELKANTVYIAQGDYHLTVVEDRGVLRIKHDKSEREQGHRPAVDPLFRSVAKLPVHSIAAVLTGMGKDGLDGAKTLFATGRSFVMAQSAESSVVFGMPREVINARVVHESGDLLRLRHQLIEMVSTDKKRTRRIA